MSGVFISPTFISDDCAEWCARQQGNDLEDAAANRSRLCELISRLTVTYRRELACVNDDQLAVQKFQQRILECLFYHWRQLAADRQVPMERAVAEIQKGNVGKHSVKCDLFRDVALACALEFREQRAAESFEGEFMPLVRGIASRICGPRGGEMVENFAADLILPREGREPRIAQYRGKTSLSAWLRVVVTNHCTSILRRRTEKSLADEEVGGSKSSSDFALDHRPCGELIGGLVFQVVSSLPPEDRVMIQMLVVDETPQQQVAKLFGVHSGNITRRRQRVTQQIWAGLEGSAEKQGKAKLAGECLDTLLTDGNRELQQALGAVLAAALKDGGPLRTEAEL